MLRAALGNTGTEDYVDYFAKIKQNEFKPPTSRSRSGSSTDTCSCTDSGLNTRVAAGPRG